MMQTAAVQKTSSLPAGLRTASELSATRPDGDRIRYMGGCRCVECRRANTAYESARARARKAGDWNGCVDATRAREHVASLRKQGIGRRQIADAACVAQSIMVKIAAGTRLQIRARTERSILAVTPAAAADHALISAPPTWKLLDQLLACGYSKAHLARELGYKTPAIQIKRTQCTVRTAHDVQHLHERLRRIPATGTLKLLEELRVEGYRRPRIEAMATAAAALAGQPPPDFAVYGTYVSARAAAIVRQLHAELTGEPS